MKTRLLPHRVFFYFQTKLKKFSKSVEIVFKWVYYIIIQRGKENMNKTKVKKLLNQLENNLNEQKNENVKLYVDSWCIGTIHMLKSKMDGNLMNVYPRHATYKELYRELSHYIVCTNASDSVKKESNERIFTVENASLMVKIGKEIYR